MRDYGSSLDGIYALTLCKREKSVVELYPVDFAVCVEKLICYIETLFIIIKYV